ncbi:MAG: hypothetical protein ACTSRS_15370 [Candidatus Helarchaeota archaeon]
MVFSFLLNSIGIPLFHIGGPWFSAPTYGAMYLNGGLYYYLGIFLVPLSWLLLLNYNRKLKGDE